MTDATPAEIAARLRQVDNERRRPRVLALDLATESGWAIGRPGEEPLSGTVRFAAKGATPEAIDAGAYDWFLAFSREHSFDEVVIEQAVHKPQYKSSHASNAITHGLIRHFRFMLFKRGIFRNRIKEAPVNSVRAFFLGQGNLPREEAKHRTVMRCRALCWDPANDDAADALAMWAWRCAYIDPAFGTSLSPLFNKRRAIA